MPVSASVRKRVRQNKKARMGNRIWKSRIKTVRGKLTKAIMLKDVDKVQSLYRDFVSLVDRAASKGLLHRKNASRKKARVAQKINNLKA